MATAVDSVTLREPGDFGSRGWTRVFELWHLLSLDAPTIAALWAWFFARAMRIDLPWHAPLLLAIGSWLIYVADRILDGFRRDPAVPLRPRHLFHARYREPFLAAVVAAGCLLVWLIFNRMTANARHEDTLLFAAALLYLCLVHKPGGGSESWFPKELAVGIVFAAATAVPAWSRMISGRLTLFPAIIVFAALCWLNCVAIERWENLSPTDRSSTLAIAAHRTTRWATNHFRPVALAIAALSVLLGIAEVAGVPVGAGSSRIAAVYVAAFFAALILASIDQRRHRMSRMRLRIAADLALLTPLALLPFLT